MTGLGNSEVIPVVQGEHASTLELRSAYLLPPDLFVSELSRQLIEPVIRDLLNHGTLPEHCLADPDDSVA